MRMDQPAGPTESPGFARFRPHLPLAILVVLPCLLVGWALRSGGMLYGMDMLTGSYYIRAFVGHELAEGRVGQWDPNSMCGFPLMAALQSGVFYPLTWPILILGPGAFWNYTVLIHLILAGLFAYAWLRQGLSLSPWAALLGGIVSMLSGYLLTHMYAGHISQISAYPWLAGLLWRTERLLLQPTLKRWTLLAVAMALLILPGFPQFAFFGGLLLGVRLVLHVLQNPAERKQRLKIAAAAAGAAALGALFAAPQLLPTMELIPRAQRVSINTYEFATTYSLPFENLLTLLAPSLFGDGNHIPYWGRSLIWEICGFVGLGTLALGALAIGGRHPQRFVWAGLAITALLLALGPATPLFKIFYHVVPGVSLFRAPGRYLALFTLALSALSAIGLDRWLNDEEGLRRATLKTGIGAAAVLVALLLCFFFGSKPERGNSDFWQGVLAAEESGPESYSLAELRRRFPDFPETSYAEARKSLIWAGLSLAIVTAGFLAHARGLLRGRHAAAIVAAVVVFDLASFGSRFLKGVPDTDMPWPQEFADFVRKQPEGPFRIASPGKENVKHVGKSQMAGIHHVGGYESMLLRSYSELMNVVCGQPADKPTVMATIIGPDPVLDMLGVKFWLLPKGMPLPPGWKKIAWVDDCEIFESPAPFRRAFLVPKAVSLPLRDVRLQYLASPTTDLKKFVVLETPEPAYAVPREGDLGSARILSYGTGWYEIAAETASGAYLVLTEADYPGWEAKVDGTPAEILRANHFVQALWLPPGKHQIRFEYHSRWLGLGFLLCLLAAALPAGLAILGRLRKAPATSTAAPS